MFHPRKFYNVTYWVYAVFPGHFNVTRLWCRRKPGKYRFWTKIPIALPWILIKGDGDYIIHNIGCLVTIINFISPLYCWKKVQTLKAEPFLWLVLALYRCTRNADCVWSLYSLDYLLLQVCSLFFFNFCLFTLEKKYCDRFLRECEWVLYLRVPNSDDTIRWQRELAIWKTIKNYSYCYQSYKRQWIEPANNKLLFFF